jgi:hypothetical protein
MIKTCPKCGKEHDKNGKFCSRSCANSRTWSEDDKKKKSDSVLKTLEERGEHWAVGKSGWAHSDEQKEVKRRKTIEYYDRTGRRLTEEQKKAKNVAGVQAYRQKKYSATPLDVNRKLIRKIYENCPEGYEVDHIVALCNGGPHHQDNLQYLPAMENRKKNRTDKYDKYLVIRWQDIVTE